MKFLHRLLVVSTASMEQSQDFNVGLGPTSHTRWPGIFLGFRGECPTPQGIPQFWTNHECGPALNPQSFCHMPSACCQGANCHHTPLVPSLAAPPPCLLPVHRVGPAFRALSPVSGTAATQGCSHSKLLEPVSPLEVCL